MGSLMVHVLDEDGDPARGKRVLCNFVGSFLGITDTHLEDYDNIGTVEFDEIPTRTIEVYVDGDFQVRVSVGENDHEDVTVTL